jgi:tRNA-specific 2-thiouridylase
MNKKVLVAMSGGIDSTVTAIMLKNQGYEVIGITLKTWDFDSSGVNPNSVKKVGCCDLDDINDAREICVEHGIPHYILDIREEFTDSVVENFVDEYMAGRTPNPCIMCNTHIKWGALIKRADALGCDYIATGHYAKINKTSDGRYYITSGIDKTKDQSYVLWGLSQEVMVRTLLPMGNYIKADIKKMALDWGYKNLSTKSESYEICFIPDDDYRAFLSRKREIKKGPFIDTDFKEIGEHDGYPYFTIGQRRGLGITFDEAHYVVNIIPETNEVMLGTADKLMKRSMLVRNVNGVRVDKDDLVGMEVLANVRYRGDLAHARILPTDDDDISRLDFHHSVNAITPGQSTVFYDINKPDDVLGGGHIYKVIE